MAKKKRGNLASGSTRVRVFVGYRADGSRRYESFTSANRQRQRPPLPPSA